MNRPNSSSITVLSVRLCLFVIAVLCNKVRFLLSLLCNENFVLELCLYIIVDMKMSTTVRTSRFSSIIKTKGIRLSKEQKDRLRLELKHVKEHSRALKEARKQEQEEKRRRRQENLMRQKENRKKSEIVQVVSI
ncbi:hypothetical protein C0J52_07861 [Blattella germanica]|nr:hypothetical protein C0J52_07861 [Blattella germanica]